MPGVVRLSLLDLARTWVGHGWHLHLGTIALSCGAVVEVGPAAMFPAPCPMVRPVFPSSLRERVTVVGCRAGVWGLQCFCPFVPQGEFRALEQGRVREVFGSGTACQICPVHQILYEGKVSRSCRGWRERKGKGPILTPPFPLKLHIPTVEKGPELILRFQNELKAIQVSSGVAILIMNTCGQKKYGNFLCFWSLCGFGS